MKTAFAFVPRSRWIGLAVLLALALSGSRAATAPTVPARTFELEALVDFPDDTIVAGRALTPKDIDAMMTRLAELGVKRVSWIYYGDAYGGFLNPAGYVEDDPYQSQFKSEWQYYDATYRVLGNPLKVAVEAGHRHGLQVYAYFKPYETGPAMMFPAGTPEAAKWGQLDCLGGKLAWIAPFVREHPELRIKRRTDDLPAGVATATVQAIRLTKKDATPTRLAAEHLQVWTSPNNHQYQRKEVKFSLQETVEPAAREVTDQHGKILTRAGDPVRVLTLRGLHLEDKFILVTTDFAGGKADFVNSGLALMTMLDGDGREIPGTFASGGTVWAGNLVDFRRAGLMFDYGWGAAAVVLDAPNTQVQRGFTADLPLDAAEANGKQGFIAFTRGRNAYLPGALCETEPKVQEFWLRCLDDMVAAGVDGVDFREENHSTHTDHPEDYGYNDVVMAQAKARSGDLRTNIAEVRGEAYTAFLRECHRRLAAAGKSMRYNLQLDFFRPQPPPNRLLAYPANIHFQWQRWIDEGLLDGSIIRFFSLPLDAVFNDPIGQEMVSRSLKHGLPIAINRYVTTPAEKLTGEVQRVRADGRFRSFILYETSDFLKFGPNPGECFFKYPPVEQAARDAR